MSEGVQIQDRIREILRSELDRRMKKNPSYSLRAFAKTLGTSHANLSFILNRQRNVSAQTLKKFVEKLELSPQEHPLFFKKIQDDEEKRTLKNSTGEYTTQDLEWFSMVSNWIHFAILSLINLPEFKMENPWIAKRLNASVTEVSLALQRLKSLELIEEYAPGKWRQSGRKIGFKNKVSTTQTRQYHTQLLDKAVYCLENYPMDLRDFSTITFEMNTSQIPMAIKKIRSFRRKLSKTLSKGSVPNEVYQLSVLLFPLTQIQGEKQ